jgi:plasmid stabilization system protein ParE
MAYRRKPKGELLSCEEWQRFKATLRFGTAYAKARIMAKGSKAKYSDKQKRKAEHIEDSYEKRGMSKKTAAKRAWQTVNKQSGGGEKSGGGRKATASAKTAARKESGERAARSRKVGSRRVQSSPTRHKASSSAKRKS